MSLRVDSYNLVTAGNDNGDACQRTYSVLLLVKLLTNLRLTKGDAYENAKNQLNPAQTQYNLEVSPGIYIRHPDGWCANPDFVSRDQLVPVISYLALMANSSHPEVSLNYRKDLTNLLWACLKRGMFAQNKYENNTSKWKVPDVITPELWAVFASGYVKTYWAPLAILFILIGDFFSIFSSALKVWTPKTLDGGLTPAPDQFGEVDDTNINNVISVRQHCFPSPFSWFARKIYKWFRKPNYGVTELKETSNVMGAIAWYNRNDNTDITELHRPLVERY